MSQDFLLCGFHEINEPAALGIAREGKIMTPHLLFRAPLSSQRTNLPYVSRAKKYIQLKRWPNSPNSDLH